MVLKSIQYFFNLTWPPLKFVVGFFFVGLFNLLNFYSSDSSSSWELAERSISDLHLNVVRKEMNCFSFFLNLFFNLASRKSIIIMHIVSCFLLLPSTL